MKEVKKLNFRQAANWLEEEVEIRAAKKWLVLAAIVGSLLLLLALD